MPHCRVARHEHPKGFVSRLSFALRDLGYLVELRLYQLVPAVFHGGRKTAQASASCFVSSAKHARVCHRSAILIFRLIRCKTKHVLRLQKILQLALNSLKQSYYVCGLLRMRAKSGWVASLFIAVDLLLYIEMPRYWRLSNVSSSLRGHVVAAL